MGIHAADNLSHLAYDATEPYVPDHYDYDEYVIMELSEPNTRDAMWLKIGGSYKYWQDARADFIKMFTQEHRKVKLVGRVFN